MTAAAIFSAGAAEPRAALRRLLALDAVVTAANGLAYLALSGPVGDLLGVDSTLLLVLGAFLVVYALDVGWLASRRSPSPFLANLVVEANVAWTLASVAVLVFGVLEPTTTGLVWVPLQAAVVLGFAVLQYGALRGVRASSAARA